MVEVWGNPAGKNLTLGLILREHQGIIADTGYVFNIQYDEIGYVDDNDADKINYDDLLKQMKEETIEENKERKKGGFEPIEVVGWAASPFYDKSRKFCIGLKNLNLADKKSIPSTITSGYLAERALSYSMPSLLLMIYLL